MSRDVHAAGHRVMRAPLHRVWQLVGRPETHPRQVRWWLTADVIERAQSVTLVEFRGLFGGLPITSVQRMTLNPPGRVEFKQVRGTLRGLSGAFVLKDRDGDTDFVIQISVDAGIPLLSEAAVQQILVGGIEATLTGLKATAERDLARPTRRPQAAAGAGPATAVAGSVAALGAVDDDDDGGPADAGHPDKGADGDVAAAPIDAKPASPEAQDVDGRRRRRRRGRRTSAPRPSMPVAGPPVRTAGTSTRADGDGADGRQADAGSGRRRRRGRRGRGSGTRSAPGGASPPASPT
jgi:hypothetical protein